MKALRNPRLWIMVLSAIAVLWLGVIDLRRTAPGPLSGVHQQEPALTGWRSCAQCHGGWLSAIGLGHARSPHETMADACRECHPAIAAQIAGGTGLHGIQAPEQATRCALCHSEHHGAEFAVVNRQSFVRAGFAGREAFRHDAVGFALDGRHLELPCASCHAHADAFTLPKGRARYVGLSPDCATCHADAHLGAMALPCARCHEQATFLGGSAIDHDRHLPLVGAHGGLSCRACHAQDTPHALEALGRATPLPARACADCHASPHRPGFVAGVAAQAGRTEPEVCVVCHTHGDLTFQAPGAPTTPAQHAAAGFALEPPHQAVPCAQCHAPELGAFARRHPGRSPDACAACHADVHGGQFGRGAFAGQGCIACHERERFVPHAFTARDHARTAMPLTGRHLDTECAQCHRRPAPDGPRHFAGTERRCEACHVDAHDGFFAGMAAVLDGPAGTCAACHTTNRFAERPVGGFAHGRFTRFTLDGAHAAAGCDVCHPLAQSRDERGRRFGQVAARFGAVPDHGLRCVPCHQDVHQGQFDDARLPRTVEGRPGCARCHQTSTFRVLARPFAHGTWTRYALDGAHARARCSTCHAPLTTPDAAGRTWRAARGQACADCHPDPHAGQFVVDGRTRCERCHQSAERWNTLVFDHQKDARFALDEAHRKVPCAGCHQPVRHGDVSVVRYRPLGMACVDCHGEHEDPLRRRKR